MSYMLVSFQEKLSLIYRERNNENKQTGNNLVL